MSWNQETPVLIPSALATSVGGNTALYESTGNTIIKGGKLRRTSKSRKSRKSQKQTKRRYRKSCGCKKWKLF